MESPDIPFSAGPKGDDLYEWVAALPGPDDTPYAGGMFTNRKLHADTKRNREPKCEAKEH